MVRRLRVVRFAGFAAGETYVLKDTAIGYQGTVVGAQCSSCLTALMVIAAPGAAVV